jgi:hypothetical protein
MEPFEIVLPSSLFPFRREDLPGFDWGEYRLENVFRRIDPPRQQACVELWIGAGVIPSPKAAWERSQQVCYLLWHRDTGQLAGLNTLYPERPETCDQDCFINRMFIRPEHRRTRLMIVATAATVCYAKTRLATEGIPGVLNVNENRKLGRPGMRRIFTRLGYRPRGSIHGRDAWYFDFSAVLIRDAPVRQLR